MTEYFNDKKIFTCCPFCGEDYMFNPLSHRDYFDESGKLTMVISKYWCDSCRNYSTIIHDFVNDHVFGDN